MKQKGKHDYLTNHHNPNYAQPGLKRGNQHRKPESLSEQMQNNNKFRRSKSKSQVANYENAAQVYRNLQAPPILNNAAKRT